MKIYRASKYNLFNLEIPELHAKIDYEDLFVQLPFLMNLTLTLGVKHAGTNYKRDNLGMDMHNA